jgi:hypothetical protein
VNAYAILVGLLLLAWAGDALVKPAGRRAFGLSSGTEFLLGGILLGPLGLGTISRGTLEALSPLTAVGAAWLGLLAGTHLGFADNRRVPLKHFFAGLLLGAAAFAACALAGWALAPRILPLDDDSRLLLALGLGAAGSETARAAVVWSAEREGPRSPLLDLFADLAEADDVVPLVGLAALFALAPRPEGTALAGAPGLALVLTLGLGVCLGAIGAALTRVEARATERWGVLLGTALLGVGLSARLGLAAPAALFVMGLTLNQLAEDGAVLRQMLDRTTRPVLLPVVALAGASLDLRDGRAVWWVVAAVPLVRLAVKLPLGALFRGVVGRGVQTSRWMGLGLMSSGAITVCVGITAAERFDGPVGRLVLAAALSSVVVGELVGPPALQRELKLAGDWTGDAPGPRPAEEGRS